ncbi:MAG: Fur family transcriptional regulator [Acidimicrobiia bacterium]
MTDTDAIMSDLREQGVRVTTVRRAVIGVLAAEHAHQSADDLAEAVQRDHPDIHRSTIYRTLDSLEKLGVVDHVHLGHGRAVYHLSAEPHHHLVCESCGRVVHAPDDLFDQLAAEVLERYEFTVRPNHFAVLGRCRDCVGA